MRKITLPKIKKPKISRQSFQGKHKHVYIALLGIIIVLSLALVVFNSIDNNKDDDSELLAHISRLELAQANCEQVINEIGNISAKDYGAEAQKKLLQKQMICFADTLKLDQATIKAQELKHIYDKEGSAENAAATEVFLNNLNENKKLKDTAPTNAKPDPVL